MTQKDFDVLAMIVWQVSDMAERRRVAQILLPAFRECNPAFDTARFLQLCGL